MNTYGRPKYWLLTLVQVDRGMIPSCYKNGQPVMGRHIPYYAGLIIQDNTNGKRYFLDEFNSEIMLREYLGYNSDALRKYDLKPSLREMVEQNQFIMLGNNINLLVVADLDIFLKTNGIIKKRRDVEAMYKIAKDIRTCEFKKEQYR